MAKSLGPKKKFWRRIQGQLILVTGKGLDFHNHPSIHLFFWNKRSSSRASAMSKEINLTYSMTSNSMVQILSRKYHFRTILAGVFVTFFVPFLLAMVFPAQLDRKMDVGSYVAFHNTAEFFSIMVSLCVFSVGWFTFDQSKDRHALFLGTAFLAVGLLDFMHTLSNAAMPAFITPNSTNKSTQFWIYARLLDASAFLISAFIYPETQNRWLTKKLLMTTALALTSLVFIGVIFFEPYLPATAIRGVGLTPLKRYAEYLVIILLVAAFASYWRRMVRTGDRTILHYLAAFIICIFSEVVFASYKTGFDTYNVLGHIYKIVAFSLIYKGVFATSVRKPYVELSDANARLKTYTAKLERMNKELEEFAFVASHDLQEPLRKIQTFSDLIPMKCQGPLGVEAEGHLLRVKKEAKRMSGLIRCLLSYSRLSAEEKPFGPTDLNKVVHGTLHDLEPELAKRDGEAEIGELPVIEADSTQIRQLFLNLFDNSLKFCSEGEKPLIKVCANVHGETCRISVEDNGIGFEEQFSELVFKPFKRLHGRTSRYEGMGMGLTICRRIVDRHGGNITVKSTPAHGSTFIITLPTKQLIRKGGL